MNPHEHRDPGNLPDDDMLFIDADGIRTSELYRTMLAATPLHTPVNHMPALMDEIDAHLARNGVKP